MIRTPPDEPGFTVVIGGGGAMAIGISVGMMMALRDAGLDAAEASTTVGTSAGATVAADVQLGRSLEDIAGRVCTDAFGDDGPVDSMPSWTSMPDLVRRSIGSGWVLARALSPVRLALPEPPRLLQRVFPGSLLALGDADDWAAEFYPEAWPAGRVWAIAADLDTNRRVVLEAEPPPNRPQATLREALRAACAVPGIYPPVRVDGARLVDGGLRSFSNLDVAAQLPQRAVLGISALAADPADPPSGPGRFLRSVPNRGLLREASYLRRRGHEVLLMRPGRATLELAGTTVLSGRISGDLVEAAYDDATRRLAEPDMQRRLDRLLGATAGAGVA